MARAIVKAGNKRYQVSIKQVAFERMTEILKEIGAPNGTLGTMIDDYVQQSLVLFEHMLEVKKKEGRTMTFIETMGIVGKMIDVGAAKDN